MWSFLLNIGILASGFIVLLKGADWFVDSAAAIARIFRVSEFTIGLTLIAFSTSFPELSVSVLSSIQGFPDIALGNVIGSNIANVGLVIGLAVILKPIISNKKDFKESMVMVLFLLLAVFFLWGGIHFFEGIVLVFALFGYLYYLGRKNRDSNEIDRSISKKGLLKYVVFCFVGLAGVFIGSNAVVFSSTNLAKLFGVPEIIIGLTVIAIGTSLPELATVLVAIKKNYKHIALGTIIGSNIFNVLMVLGAASLFNVITVSKITLLVDVPFMLLLSLILTLFLYIGNKLARKEGIILMLIYIAYIGSVLVRSRVLV